MKTKLLLTFALVSGALFAQQVASDSLTDTSGTTLPAHNAHWLISAGGLSNSFNIQSNAAGPNNGGARELFAYWNAAFKADQYSQGTVAAIASGCYIGLSVRASRSSAYYAQWSSSGVYLRKVVAGVVAADLASNLTTLTMGDVMRLEVSGTTLTLRRNGIVELTATDSALSSGAAGVGGGYGSSGCGTRVNAWSGGNLTLNISTATVPNADVGSRYSKTFVANGGAPEYTWAVTAGALPTGLTLSGGGVLSGTPTVGGVYNFTVRVTDAVPNNVSQVYTITANTLDSYGGALNKPCTGGVKPQAYTEQIGAQWYLCTPLGHAFFFQGVSHLDYGQAAKTDGGYTYADIIASKFASDPNGWQYGWVDNTLARLKAWGFNAIGDSSSIIVMPFFGAGGINGVRLPATKLATMPSALMTRSAFFNTGRYASSATKNLMDYAIISPLYRGAGSYVGRGLPDAFDPVYAAYILESYHQTATTYATTWGKQLSSPYSFAYSIDESDDIFGLAGSGVLESPAPPDGVYHPHVGYVVATSNPAIASTTAFGGQTFSSSTNYSKLELRKELDGPTYGGKYANIAALNGCWGSNYTTFGSAGGWPRSATGGTGLMDEDGPGTWLGARTGFLNTDASVCVRTDLDAFLLAYSRKYFSVHRTAFKTYAPTQLMMCPLLNGHGGLSRRQTLQAAGEYCDVIEAGTTTSQSELDNTTRYAGNVPIFGGFVGTPANTDSAMHAYANPVGSPASTQPGKGTEIFKAISSLLTARSANTHVNPNIGFMLWEWADNWNDNGRKLNWGLVTARDNAYDGLEAVSGAARACQSPQAAYSTCGGEDLNYGDLLSTVRLATALWLAPVVPDPGGTAGGSSARK